MKKLSLILFTLLIFFNSCKDNEIIELNCTSSLSYIKRNGRVDSTMIDHIKADWSRRHIIEFQSRNDTLFAYGSELNEEDKNYRLSPYVTSRTMRSSELICSKKIIIHQNEIKYSFCYSDINAFFDKQIKKSENDIYFINYIGEKENLLNQITEKESIFYCDYIIYDLLLNLPFSAYDKYSKEEISKIILSDYYSGWSGGSEYYLLDKENDTIAYHGFQRWIN